MFLRLLAVALCAAASMALPAGAGAHGFSPATDLTVPAPPYEYSCGRNDCKSPSADAIRIAANAAGDTVAAWLSSESTDSRGPTYKVEAAYRPAGGAFGPKQTLGTFAWRGWDLAVPGVGIAQDGRAFVSWNGRDADDSGNESIWIAQASADGTFVDSRALEQVGQGVPVPRLAVGPDGHAILAWDSEELDQNGASRSVIRASTRDPGGDFSAPVRVATGGLADVEVARNGAELVTGWAAGAIFGSMRPAEGDAFAAPQTLLAPSEHPDRLRTAIAPDGRAILSWVSDGSPSPIMRVRFTTAAGAPDGPVVELPNQDATYHTSPSVAFDADGTAVAAWNECPDTGTATTCHFAAAEAPPNGAFGPRTLIPGEVSYPGFFDLASGPGGHVFLLHRDFDGAGVHIARRISGATFEELSPVPHGPGTVDDPQIAVDGDGNPAVAWRLETPDELSSVQIAFGDWTAPKTEAEVPSTARPGEVVAMRATATDPSGATVAWDFGDGARAPGAEVSHAYAERGRYTVQVTATDGKHNERTVTRTIDVAAPAPATPPAPPEGAGPPAAVHGAPPPPIVQRGVPAVRATVKARFAPSGRRTEVQRLAVIAMEPGAAVRIRCKGQDCPFSTRRWASTSSGWRNARRAFGKHTRLRAGTVIVLRITAPGRVRQVVRYRLRAGRQPAVRRGGA
ncbi:MAG TPA: PKD domain-containing protein [Solirubrobacteraceae bacterium]|jgi:hypothetical protein